MHHRLGVFVLFVGFWLGVAQSAWATSPTGTLEAFFARTNKILETVNPARGLEAPRQAVRDLFSVVFDFREAAAVALGPEWLSRIPADQDEFTRLFAIFLERGFIAVVGSQASVAGGVRIQYLGESVHGESASVATTLLTRGGQELPVDYWMIRRGGRWKVQDVVVDGVSLVMNYRAQFARVLAAYPYAELVARMQAMTPPGAQPTLPLLAQSTPSLPPAAGVDQVPAAVVRDVPTERSVRPPADRSAKLPAGGSAKLPAGGSAKLPAGGSAMLKVVKPAQTEQQIPKSKSGGTTREAVPVAAMASAPGDPPRPVDVVGRLLVKSRSGAERALETLLARAGGTTLSRQRGAAITVVKGVIPHSNYGSFAAGLRGIGSWQIEVERSPLPNVLHVTVRLAE